MRKDKEKHRAYMREYFRKNMKEYMREYMKKWRKTHPRNRIKGQIRWQKRRARKQNAEGSFTLKEWETLKAQYGFRCPACGKEEPKIKLTMDHIIPLYRGGSNYIENIQPLCVSCNSSKGTKIIKFDLQG